eukprot:655617-Prorocentrum_minimum.AAC.1
MSAPVLSDSDARRWYCGVCRQHEAPLSALNWRCCCSKGCRRFPIMYVCMGNPTHQSHTFERKYPTDYSKPRNGLENLKP